MLSDFATHVLAVPDHPKLPESDSGVDQTYAFRTPSLRERGGERLRAGTVVPRPRPGRLVAAGPSCTSNRRRRKLYQAGRMAVWDYDRCHTYFEGPLVTHRSQLDVMFDG